MGTSARTPFFASHPLRRSHRQAVSFLPRALPPVLCGLGAILLISIAGGALFLFWASAPPSAAFAASNCPITGLPPTPTAGNSLDPSSIKLNEILTAPKKDWNCDGKADGGDQWIELKNTSGSDESLFGLQLESQGQVILLNTSYRIAANGYLVIFSSQVPTIPFVRGAGQLQLLDSSGATIDAVNYPPLEIDQSYSRHADGTWSVSDTPTPGLPNTSSPTPTATKRSGGGSGGGGSSPTATPTPIGTIFIPTDTPAALQNTGTDPSTDAGNGGESTPGVPSWVKIALLALLGAALLGVVVWYLRSWNQVSEDES